MVSAFALTRFGGQVRFAPTRRPTAEAFSVFLASRAASGLLVLVAAAVFVAVSWRPLSHSELRYVEAGREMVADGDWIVPHLSFVPYFEKPILTYWAEALAQIAFGTGVIAVRAPSIVACIAMVWTTYAFGRALRGPAFGLGAGALLLSSVMFQEMGTAILTNSLFSAFLAFAWYAFWRHDRAPRSGWIWAFWTSLGFAVLTKGPLGVALVGATVGLYLLLAGRFRDAVAMRLARGAAVIAAINVPWSILVWRRDPRFLEFFYVRQNLHALVDERINHAGSSLYYFPFVVLALVPFVLLGVWAVGEGTWAGIAPAVRRLLGRVDEATPVDERRLYLACMFVPPLLLLSASASKLATYILPLFPAMALIVAWHVADRLASPTSALRRLTLVQAAALIVAAMIAPFILERRTEDWIDVARAHATTLWIAASAMLVPMLAGGIAMARGRVIAGMTTVGAGAFALVLVVNSALSDLDVVGHGGPLVRQMNAVRSPEEAVVVSGPCSDDYSIVLELRERPKIWGVTSELGMGHFTEVTPRTVPIPDDPYKIGGDHLLPENEWLLDTRELRTAWIGDSRVWFVGRTKDVERLRRENRLQMHVFAENARTSIATNLPLPTER